MTAVSLLDVLAQDGGGDPDPQRAEHAVRFARKLVDAALADWRRVAEYEEQFGSAEYAVEGAEDAVNRSLYGLYERWAEEAGQILDRTRRLAVAGWAVENTEALEDAFARCSVRLKLTPEMIARAMEQVRQGHVVPIEGLRDELRARIRG